MTATSDTSERDPEASPESLLALLDKDDATNRLLARHPKASADLLEKLSHSSDKATRQAVASNPNTPPQTFVRLGQQFPKAFLANPALDLLLMVSPDLIEQAPQAFLIRLLKQADCPSSLLVWAAGHWEAKVQLAVAMNVKAPKQALDKLQASTHPSVLEAVQSKGGTGSVVDPEKAFEQAVRDRLGSLPFDDLVEAWNAGDIGLAQWSALPLTFRLIKACDDTYSSAAIAAILRNTTWTLDAVRDALPNFPWWAEVARVSDVPVSVLEALAKDAASDVRRAVAGNPSAPLPILEMLAQDASDDVRCAVAGNPLTPATVLESLAKDSEVTVRTAVAGNSATPLSVLQLLALDPIQGVKKKLAANSSMPMPVREALFDALAKDSNQYVRQAVADDPTAPVLLLLELVKDSELDVRRLALRTLLTAIPKLSTPVTVLVTLANNSDVAVRSAVAGNPLTPVNVLDALAQDSYESVRSAVAANTSSASAALELLGMDSDPSVRRSVAGNTATPVAILEALAKDSDTDVRSAVAGNLATPVRLLEALFEDTEPATRVPNWRLAGNPACPVSLLEALAHDSSQSVRAAVAANTATPPEVIGRLASDRIAEVAIAAVRNPNISLVSLLPLAKSKTVSVRQALAETQALRSNELCRLLWADPNEIVRRSLASTRRLPPELLDEFAQSAEREYDMVALLWSADMRAATAQLLADKLLTTEATASPWYRQKLTKASPEEANAAQACEVASYFGKNPNKAALAKRPVASVLALCSGPFIEPSRIVKLAGSTDWLIRAAVARNSGTPTNLLKKLAGDAHPMVASLALAAQQRSAPQPSDEATKLPSDPDLERAAKEVVDRLRRVSSNETFRVSQLVIHELRGDEVGVGDLLAILNWRSPESSRGIYRKIPIAPLALSKILQLLSSEQARSLFSFGVESVDVGVRTLLAQSSACPSNVFERLKTDNERDVLSELLGSPVLDLPKSDAVRDRFLGLRWPTVKPAKNEDDLKKARHPITGLSTAEALSKHWDSNVRCEAAANPAFPAPVLEALLKDSSKWVRFCLAGNPAAPIAALDALAKDSASDVRREVAGNPATPVSLLGALAEDSDSEVRRAVAANASSPFTILEALAKDSHLLVRHAVAGNAASSAATLQTLGKAAESEVRRAVAANAACPVATLAFLAKDLASDVRRTVAGNPASPVAALDALARESVGGSRYLVAGNPATPVQILEELAQDSLSSVRRAVACNLTTPVSALEVLARDGDSAVRCAVAGNSAAPAPALEILARDSDSDVRRAVAGNPATPEMELATLVTDSVAGVRYGVCTRPVVPAWALDVLAQDSQWLIRCAVAANLATSVAALEALAKDSDSYVRRAVAGNRATPETQLATLAQDSEKSVRCDVAANSAAPMSALNALAEDSEELVRLAVAGNPATPAPALMALAKDSNKWVRYEVAANPATPVSALEVLAKDSESIVIYKLARNPSAPIWVLEELAKDLEADLRRSVAGNPATPVATLEILATDPEFRVFVAGNPSAPAAAIEALAKDSGSEVRRKVAGNPTSSNSLLSELSKDPEWPVRLAVAINPKTPASTLEVLAKDSVEWVRYGSARDHSTGGVFSKSPRRNGDFDVIRSLAFNSFAPEDYLEQYIQGWAGRLKQAIEREVYLRDDNMPKQPVRIRPRDLLRGLDWLGLVSAEADNKVLTKASRSKDWLTRLGAALHPLATKGILELLSKDSDPDVARAAAMPRSEVSARNEQVGAI